MLRTRKIRERVVFISIEIVFFLSNFLMFSKDCTLNVGGGKEGDNRYKIRC